MNLAQVRDELLQVNASRGVVVHVSEGAHEGVPGSILLANVLGEAEEVMQLTCQILVVIDGLDEFGARDFAVTVAVNDVEELLPSILLRRHHLRFALLRLL